MQGQLTAQAKARLTAYSTVTQLAAMIYIGALVVAIAALGWIEYRRPQAFIQTDPAGTIPYIVTGLAMIAGALSFLVAMIGFLLWFHKAIANLHAVRLPGLKAKPIWSTASFFVPVAQVFLPFVSMRELWNRSHGEDQYQSRGAVTQVTVWWMSFLTGTFLVFFVTGLGIFNRISPLKFIAPSLLNLALTLSGLIFWSTAAWSLVVILRAITRAQATLVNGESVFS